jgi:hypothetical protein
MQAHCSVPAKAIVRRTPWGERCFSSPACLIHLPQPHNPEEPDWEDCGWVQTEENSGYDRSKDKLGQDLESGNLLRCATVCHFKK